MKHELMGRVSFSFADLRASQERLEHKIFADRRRMIRLGIRPASIRRYLGRAYANYYWKRALRAEHEQIVRALTTPNPLMDFLNAHSSSPLPRPHPLA